MILHNFGYWGPTAGFSVQGDFTNTTPIKATFPEEGNYTITLTLQDVTNNYVAIESRTFTIQVYEDNTGGNIVSNVVDNNLDNSISELPKTGTSIIEYVMYFMIAVLIISIIGIYINKRRINS